MLLTSFGALPVTIGRWLVALGTLLDAGAVVGELTRHAARAVTRVSVLGHAVTPSYLVRCLTRHGCGRSHSACYRRRPGCCRALLCCCPIALGTRPVSSTVLPAPFCTLYCGPRRRAGTRAGFLARSSRQRACATRACGLIAPWRALGGGNPHHRRGQKRSSRGYPLNLNASAYMSRASG